MSPLDYGALDYLYPPTNLKYTLRHFRNFADVCVDLENSCKAGDPMDFMLHMHEMQDTGVHGEGRAGAVEHVRRGSALDNPDRNEATKAATAQIEWWTRYWEEQYRAYNPGVIETYEGLKSLEQFLLEKVADLGKLVESLAEQYQHGSRK
jgi:hypothetical protein